MVHVGFFYLIGINSSIHAFLSKHGEITYILHIHEEIHVVIKIIQETLKYVWCTWRDFVLMKHKYNYQKYFLYKYGEILLLLATCYKGVEVSLLWCRLLFDLTNFQRGQIAEDPLVETFVTATTNAVGVFSSYGIESHDPIPHTRKTNLCQAELRTKTKADWKRLEVEGDCGMKK